MLVAPQPKKASAKESALAFIFISDFLTFISDSPICMPYPACFGNSAFPFFMNLHTTATKKMALPAKRMA